MRGAPVALVTIVAGAVMDGALAAEKSGGLPQLNTKDFSPQLFWLVVTFALLYLVMAKIALPRIGEVLEERRDRIQRDLAAAERLKSDTEKALEGYEKALADARSSASGIARQTRDSLAAEVDQERHAVERQLASKLSDAEARINETKTRALASVSDIASETVVSLINKLTGQTVSKDDAARALTPASK